MIGDCVGQGFDRWLALHSLGRKPRSIEFNRQCHAVVIREWPGALNAAAAGVSADLVAEFGRRVTHYCPSRWNAMVSCLRFAVPASAEWLAFRPLLVKDRLTLSAETFAALVGELGKAGRGHGALVVRFLAQTSFRINEARQVEWGHVGAECITLPSSITKNGRARVVPFVPGTVTLLDELRAVAAVRPPFVLPQRECRTALERACGRLGLPVLSHHDFRHLFATRAVEAGVDLPTLAKWFGHGDGGRLLGQRYVHLLDEHSRRMAARVKI